MEYNYEYNLIMSKLPALTENARSFRGLFQCARCGKCCVSFLGTRVTKDDIERICKHLHIAKENFMHEYTIESNKKRGIKQPCPFFNSSSCMIYTTRPMVCRFFPLQSKPGPDGKLKLCVSPVCSSGIAALEEVEKQCQKSNSKFEVSITS